MCIVLGVTALLTGGCGGSDKESDAGASTPLPNVVPSPAGKPVGSNPTLSPSPGTNASLAENLKYELRRKTVAMAYAMGRTRATCDRANIAAKADTKLSCTVTYQGVRVPWDVTIKGQGVTAGLVKYTAHPRMGVITRAGAARFYWANKAQGEGDVRCSDIPAVKLVPLNKPTPYQCETNPILRETLQATVAGPRFYS
jgi:hypothetical protein